MIDSLGVIRIIVFFTILYYIIRLAVENGVLNALRKHDREE